MKIPKVFEADAKVVDIVDRKEQRSAILVDLNTSLRVIFVIVVDSPSIDISESA